MEANVNLSVRNSGIPNELEIKGEVYVDGKAFTYRAFMGEDFTSYQFDQMWRIVTEKMRQVLKERICL